MKVFISFLLFILISACSTPKDPEPDSAHPEGWLSVEEAEFHGAKVMSSGLYTCASCHGVDFEGGKSESSCYTCHVTYPHRLAWTDIGVTEGSHKTYLEANEYAFENCKNCHGADYNGGRLGTEHACVECHDQQVVDSW